LAAATALRLLTTDWSSPFISAAADPEVATPPAAALLPAPTAATADPAAPPLAVTGTAAAGFAATEAAVLSSPTCFFRMRGVVTSTMGNSWRSSMYDP